MGCFKCNKDADAEDLFKCDGCGISICPKCAKLSPTEMRCMNLKQNRVLCFYCEDCKMSIRQIPDLKKLIEGMQKEMETIKNMLKENAQVHNGEANMQCDSEYIISEITERERRTKNVIIFNIEESNATDTKTKVEQDTKKVRELVQEITGESMLPAKVIRLGRQTTPKRPLKVIFPSAEEALAVLKNKYKLGNNNIRISADQTPMQRKYLSDLREKLKARTEEGESNLTIKYIRGVPKIVTKNSQ